MHVEVPQAHTLRKTSLIGMIAVRLGLSRLLVGKSFKDFIYESLEGVVDDLLFVITMNRHALHAPRDQFDYVSVLSIGFLSGIVLTTRAPFYKTEASE